MKSRKAVITILIILFAIPLAAQVGDEHKGAPCSLATLRGTYGSFAEGTSLVEFTGLGTPKAPYPAVAVALHRFDGAGHWSFTYSTSLGGAIIRGATATGQYAVTPDCEMAVLGETPTKMKIEFVGTITGEGVFREVHVTFTDQAKVQSPTLRRTPPSGCSQEMLKGKYAVFGQGFLTTEAGLTPVAHVGSFVADGDGTFSGAETLKIANMVGHDTFTGKYTVNRDCTISVEITTVSSDMPLSSATIHEFGTITGEGQAQEAHLIVTDPGWVFSDTGKKK